MKAILTLQNACLVDHEVARASEIRKASFVQIRWLEGSRGTLFITMYFFVGAYLFLRNQVGPNQIIPIKLASKASAEISSWILYARKVFHIFFCTQMLLRRTSLCTGHCFALTRTHFTERNLPRAEAFHVQNCLSLIWDVFCAFGVGSSSVRSSSVLPEGVRNKRVAIYFNYLAIGGHVVLPHFRQAKHKSPCYWALGLLVAMRLKSNVWKFGSYG